MARREAPKKKNGRFFLNNAWWALLRQVKVARHEAPKKKKRLFFVNNAWWALGWVGGYSGPRQLLRQVKVARREAPKKKCTFFQILHRGPEGEWTGSLGRYFLPAGEENF